MFSGYDVICILLCIVFGLIGFKRGAIKTLISFGGFIASFIVAWIFAPEVGEWLMGLEFFKTLVELINIRGLAEIIGGGSYESLSHSFPYFSPFLEGTSNILAQGVEVVFQSLIKGIAVVISFGMIILMSNIVIGIIQKIFSGINKVPIIGGFNRIVGLLFGLVLGGSVIVVITAILMVINLFSLGQEPFLFLESSELVKSMLPFIAQILSI